LPMIASGADFELDRWGFPRIGGINREVADSELEVSGLVRSPLASAAGKSVPFCVTTEGLEVLAALGAGLRSSRPALAAKLAKEDDLIAGIYKGFYEQAAITPDHRLAPPESVKEILRASCPRGWGPYRGPECIVIELASRERWGPELRELLLPRIEHACAPKPAENRYKTREALDCCRRALYPCLKTLILAGNERNIYYPPSEFQVDEWSPGFTSREKYEAWRAGVLDGSRTQQLARGDGPFGLRELEALAKMHDAVEKILAGLYPKYLSRYGSFGSVAASGPSMRQAEKGYEAEGFFREEMRDWNLRDTIRWTIGAIGCCTCDPAVKARALKIVSGWS
jgi:hypothetical protein